MTSIELWNPDLNGLVEPANTKFRSLDARSKTEIAQSWLEAFNRLHDLLYDVSRNRREWERDQARGLLCDASGKPDLLRIREAIDAAVEANNYDFFIELGKALEPKPQKVCWRECDKWSRQYESLRLPLFITYWWISWWPGDEFLDAHQDESETRRGLEEFLSQPVLFRPWKRHYLSPYKRKCPGLCFLSHKAIGQLCSLVLNRRITRDVVVKWVHRLKLKKCQRTELCFEEVSRSISGRLLIAGRDPVR